MAEVEDLAHEVAGLSLAGEEVEEPATVTVPAEGISTTATAGTGTTESMISNVLRLVQRLEQRFDNELVALNERVNRSRLREEALHGDVQGLRSVRPIHDSPSMASLPNSVKLPKLSKVDGKDERQLRRFFRRIEGYLVAYQLEVDDARALFFVAQHFTGALEDWWENRQKHSGDNIKAGFRDFSELRDRVFTEFQGRDPAEEARDRLDKATQRGSVKDYANYVRQQLLYLPHRDDSNNLHVFRRGLSHEINASLALRKPATFAEAIEAALEVEASLHQRKANKKASLNYTRSRGRRSCHGSSEDTSSEDAYSDSDDSAACYAVQNKKDQWRKKKKSTQEMRLCKLQAAGKCFYCEERGHLARDCPKKKSAKKRAEDDEEDAGED